MSARSNIDLKRASSLRGRDRRPLPSILATASRAAAAEKRADLGRASSSTRHSMTRSGVTPPEYRDWYDSNAKHDLSTAVHSSASSGESASSADFLVTTPVTFAARSTNLPRRTKSRASSWDMVSSSRPSASRTPI